MQHAHPTAAPNAYRRLIAALERFVLARATWLSVLIVLSVLAAS